jgi:hypothetical protein
MPRAIAVSKEIGPGTISATGGVGFDNRYADTCRSGIPESEAARAALISEMSATPTSVPVAPSGAESVYIEAQKTGLAM